MNSPAMTRAHTSGGTSADQVVYVNSAQAIAGQNVYRGLKTCKLFEIEREEFVTHCIKGDIFETLIKASLILKQKLLLQIIGLCSLLLFCKTNSI